MSQSKHKARINLALVAAALALALMGTPLFALAAPLTLKDFTGCYRVQSYNGMENTFSDRFFLPTIHEEVSNKLKDAQSGSFVDTVDLDFEVPVQEPSGPALRFKFLEFPLENATTLESQDRLVLSNARDFLVYSRTDAQGADVFLRCAGERRLSLRREGALLFAHLTYQSATPDCASETHAIVGTWVDSLNCQ